MSPIQVGDVSVGTRWVTVYPSSGSLRVTEPGAFAAREQVRKELGDDAAKVRLRVKRVLGFYFVQA